MKLLHLKASVWILLAMALPIFAAPFTDNGNGTVTDTATGLVWQKCSWGQTNSDCSGSSASYPIWSVALTNCNGLTLASRSWRLPNVIELQSILDRTKVSGATIDSTAFPNTPSTGFFYWSSSSSYSFGPSAAWQVAFRFGSYVGDELKNQAGYVRCVSGP